MGFPNWLRLGKAETVGAARRGREYELALTNGGSAGVGLAGVGHPPTQNLDSVLNSHTRTFQAMAATLIALAIRSWVSDG